jgi:hypothetical protein
MSTLSPSSAGKLTKLSSDNYSAWESDVLGYLMTTGHDDCLISEPPTDSLTDSIAKQKKDRQVLGFLHVTCDAYNRTHFLLTGTAKQAWDALRAAHRKKGSSTVIQLIKSLVFTMYDENDKLEAHLLQFGETRTRLTAAGMVLQDTLYGGLLLNTMPESWTTKAVIVQREHHRPHLEHRCGR